MSAPDRDEMRNLLLHRLPADRARELEDRLIQEDDGAERLQDATYDLLDDYAGGRLTAGEQADVERYLLNAEDDRWRLAVARGLARRGGAAKQTPGALQAGGAPRPHRFAVLRRVPPAVRIGGIGVLIAACVVLVAVLLTRPLGHRGGSTAPETTVVKRGGHGPAAPIFTLTLLANAARGGAVHSVRIPPGATAVRVQAEVGPSKAHDYRLFVLNGADRVQFDAGNLSPHTAGAYVYVETEIPARALPAGAHRIIVSPEGADAQGVRSASWDIFIEPGR